MAFSPGGDIYILLQNTLDAYTESITTAIHGQLGDVVHLIVSFYFIFGFFGVMTHRFKPDMLWSVVLIPCLWSLLSYDNLYLEYCCYPFLDLAEGASSFLIGFTGAENVTDIYSLFRALDSIFSKLWTTVMSLSPSGGILSDTIHLFKVELALTIITIAYLLVYICFFVTLCTSIFSMYALFMLGGPFVFLAAFRKTRHLTMNWIRALFTFALTIIFSCLVMAICLHGFELTISVFTATKLGDEIFSLQYISVVVMAALAFILVLKTPSLAAALTGGQADNSSMLSSTLSMAGGVAVAGAAKGFKGFMPMAGQGFAATRNVLDSISGPDRPWRGPGNRPTR